MIIGLNLSHDSSISIHDDSGQILFAAQEERYSRIKNDETFPFLALRSAIKTLELGRDFEISRIVVGSHRETRLGGLALWHEIFNPPVREGVANWRNLAHQVVPGHHSNLKKAELKYSSSKTYIHDSISRILQNENLFWQGDLSFISHHDAHSASGIIGSGYQECLGFSLDGSGDGESGVVQEYVNGITRDLLRIPDTNSLGIVYSEVTKRYGFVPNKHEGKITGLAALGEIGPAVAYLFNNINIVNGEPQLTVEARRVRWVLNRILARAKLAKKVPMSINRLVEEATSLTVTYPDLAFAIQNVIESRIIEMVDFWIARTGLYDISLSGGVFSNVRINQRIAEESKAKQVYIFPSMGDAGLAVGGVFRDLMNRQKLDSTLKFQDMFLGSKPHEVSTKDGIEVIFNKSDTIESVIDYLTDLLIQGKTIGTCIGRMEFGPRALGNRSILAAATDSAINQILNKRLNRTEFMPFAPIVLEDFASEVFELEKFLDLRPFSFMTMTCRVRTTWRRRVPAIVHVDGTARPQMINRQQSNILNSLLRGYFEKTGIPLLVNTSFNAHEEPIVESLDSALNALRANRVDVVWDGASVFGRLPQ